MEQEKTVVSLIEELDMVEIPVLTVYNKKDRQHPMFQPNLHPHIVISALDEEDIAHLKEKIWEEVKQILSPYEGHVKAEDAHLISQLQRETLVDSLEFLETENRYYVKGFAKKNSKWLGVIGNNESNVD